MEKKSRIRSAFEKAVWWTGVVSLGLIAGISIQFARAWVSPGSNPPDGNIGAPLNTSSLSQWKSGILGAYQFITGETKKDESGNYLGGSGIRVAPFNGEDPTGKSLVAVNSSGDVAFADAVQSNACSPGQCVKADGTCGQVAINIMAQTSYDPGTGIQQGSGSWVGPYGSVSMALNQWVDYGPTLWCYNWSERAYYSCQ